MTEAQDQANAVLSIITAHPEQHDQTGWGEKTECGTTMCVGGWIAYLNGAAEFRTYKTSIGTFKTGLFMKEEFETTYSGYAGKKLGLSYSDADMLFYDTNNKQAVKALQYIADGKEIDWEEIMPEGRLDPDPVDD